MAGDWIKMRVWLSRDPKVIRMADWLADNPKFSNPMGLGPIVTSNSNVTRNVTTALCVTGLLITWGTAREQGDRDGDDLVLRHCSFSTIDAMSGMPLFGQAMGFVEWAIERADGSVSFPKFFKENESPDDRHRRQNAERQARHRALQHNVTSNVTVTHREEKRREELTTTTKEKRGAVAPVSRKSPLPENWVPSERTRAWAREHGYGDLGPYLETFIGRYRANGKAYVDWDQTLKNAIREDWYGLRKPVGREPTLAEKRAHNMALLTGKVKDERVIEGERVGYGVVLTLPSDLREPGNDDVGGRGPDQSAAGLG